MLYKKAISYLKEKRIVSKTINKFGKPSVDIAGIKDFLIDENDELIKGDRQINEVYISQKKKKIL